MNILVINWRDIYNPEAGGAETHIHELLKRKPAHWQIDFVSAAFPGCSKTESTPWYTILRIPNNLFFNLTFWWWWLTKGKNKQYDIIIDDISKIPLATPWFIKTKPVLAIMHHIHGKSLFNTLAHPLALYVYLMEKHLLHAYVSTPLLAVSPSTAEELRTLYPFQRLSIAHNGISLTPLLPQEKQTKRQSQPLILYLGRLKAYKRADHFVAMAHILLKAIPNAQFVIAGQGEEMDTLQNQVKTLGHSDKIAFAGFVDEERKKRLLEEAWVMVVPSEKEGWGIVALEANAMGTPVVGYDIPGLRDSVVHNTTGLLVTHQTPEALAETTLRLVNDTALWQRLSQGGLEWASHFHWDEMAKIFYANINQVREEFYDQTTL